MGFEKRIRANLPTPGPFLAEVTNLLDPMFQGAMEVALIKGIPNSTGVQNETFVVKYLSPFYGVTSARYEGNNSSDFNDVQKSYGMWMVPPDIGTVVMVIFVDGDPNQGYWFGCVQDAFQNHMVPGIAASKQTNITNEQRQKYGTDFLPVAEFHKASNKLDNLDVSKKAKPVHPFADRLLGQGLLLDTIRGVTSSSARREHPSSVFGISTPGPLDKSAGAKKGEIGYKVKRQVPVSRLGGSTFVMDDGDENGQNELVRIRTRTGHQILMHNTNDLIYIANSQGTAWIELTSNGKIDIYAADSVSIHSEADFNFRADRDINLEAGRNLNINVNNNMNTNVVNAYNVLSGGDSKQSYVGSFNLLAGADLKMQSGGIFNQSSGSEMRLTSAGNLNVGSNGNIVVTGARVDVNGVAATPAAAPDIPTPLEKFTLPNRSPSAGWANGNFFKGSDIISIMQRVPTHEPWDHHESVDPQKFSSAGTDVQVNQSADAPSNPTAPAGNTPVNSNPVAVPASKSASSNEAYCQAIFIAAGVTDPVKLAAWMSQCKQESGGFIYLKEIASGSDYEGRRDLGNTQPGDGVKYKGRGFIQCTGKDNYASMSKYFNQDFINHPELVEQLEWAAKSVIWFFNVYKMSRTKNVDWSNVVTVTHIVNGGERGLANRQKYFAEYLDKFKTNGIQPAGYLGSGSGGIVVDGTGNPVKSGQ